MSNIHEKLKTYLINNNICTNFSLLNQWRIVSSISLSYKNRSGYSTNTFQNTLNLISYLARPIRQRSETHMIEYLSPRIIIKGCHIHQHYITLLHYSQNFLCLIKNHLINGCNPIYNHFNFFFSGLLFSTHTESREWSNELSFPLSSNGSSENGMHFIMGLGPISPPFMLCNRVWFLISSQNQVEVVMHAPNHWVPALEFGPVVRRHKGCVFAINALLIFGLLQLQTGSWPAGVLVVWTTLCDNGSDAGLGSKLVIVVQ